jgi:hypothetical protein
MTEFHAETSGRDFLNLPSLRTHGSGGPLTKAGETPRESLPTTAWASSRPDDCRLDTRTFLSVRKNRRHRV